MPVQWRYAFFGIGVTTNVTYGESENAYDDTVFGLRPGTSSIARCPRGNMELRDKRFCTIVL